MIRTKIICTTGPSVDSLDMIEKLAKAGMSLIRINCSHGNTETRNAQIKKIRLVEKKQGRPIGVMLDLQGPKLRIGDLPSPFKLHGDQVWCLSTKQKASEAKRIIPVGFEGLAHAVKVGGRIYMDDGLIHAEVVKIKDGDVWIKLIHGGMLVSRKGLNIPYYKGNLPVLSKKDKADLAWGLRNNVDFVALSFVRNKEDILLLKKTIKKLSRTAEPLVIAKIEKPEAVDNMEEIIQVSDGILVARGDLGIELSPEKVPVVQKQLIERCRHHKKPVIVATQMLDSMRLNPIPTRAEVSDVASAIYAGTDAVLLTGETSSGKYPIEATAMMKKIIREVEDHMVIKIFRKMPRDFGLSGLHESFMFNIMQLADDINAKAIVMLTKQGNLTKIISKLHPRQPVFSLALNQGSYRQLTLFWGIFPIEMPDTIKLIDGRIAFGLKFFNKKQIIKKDDRLIFIYRDYKSENLNMKILKV